jgi:hypothetical protein
MASNKAVIGIVATQPQAEMIVIELQRSGFRTDDISVVFPDTGATRDFAHEKNTKAPEGAVTGASAGGVLGGTLGLLAGIGALAIPGLGPFIAAGPIMAALSGAAAGAAVGGVAGALVGLGIPEVEAKAYEGKLKSGKILISVHTDDADVRKRAREIMERNSATDISVVGEESVPKDKSQPVARH